MKIPAHNYCCPLGRLQPEVRDLDAMKRAGWQDQRILVIDATDERLDFVERELIRQIGERLYGASRQGGRHA